MYTSLISLKPNDYAKMKDISGGDEVIKRLCELGLHEGALFKVEKNDFGPIILNISGNKLALGRGLAASVMVEKE